MDRLNKTLAISLATLTLAGSAPQIFAARTSHGASKQTGTSSSKKTDYTKPVKENETQIEQTEKITDKIIGKIQEYKNSNSREILREIYDLASKNRPSLSNPNAPLEEQKKADLIIDFLEKNCSKPILPILNANDHYTNKIKELADEILQKIKDYNELNSGAVSYNICDKSPRRKILDDIYNLVKENSILFRNIFDFFPTEQEKIKTINNFVSEALISDINELREILKFPSSRLITYKSFLMKIYRLLYTNMANYLPREFFSSDDYKGLVKVVNRWKEEAAEQERLAKQQKKEQERLEQKRLEQERLEQKRLEKLEKERQEILKRLRQEKLEKPKREQEKQEILKRLRQERLEQERQERLDRLERLRQERQKRQNKLKEAITEICGCIKEYKKWNGDEGKLHNVYESILRNIRENKISFDNNLKIQTYQENDSNFDSQKGEVEEFLFNLIKEDIRVVSRRFNSTSSSEYNITFDKLSHMPASLKNPLIRIRNLCNVNQVLRNHIMNNYINKIRKENVEKFEKIVNFINLIYQR